MRKQISTNHAPYTKKCHDIRSQFYYREINQSCSLKLIQKAIHLWHTFIKTYMIYYLVMCSIMLKLNVFYCQMRVLRWTLCLNSSDKIEGNGPLRYIYTHCWIVLITLVELLFFFIAPIPCTTTHNVLFPNFCQPISTLLEFKTQITISWLTTSHKSNKNEPSQKNR